MKTIIEKAAARRSVAALAVDRANSDMPKTAALANIATKVGMKHATQLTAAATFMAVIGTIDARVKAAGAMSARELADVVILELAAATAKALKNFDEAQK